MAPSSKESSSMEDNAHTQTFHIRDLATQSVTLFPSRAQVVRDLKDVSLKVGSNQIIVVGLTPTTDKDSIKTEGTGSAIITDIATELLPNRDIFEEVYPDSVDDDDEDDPNAHPVPAVTELDFKMEKDDGQLQKIRDELSLLEIGDMWAKEIVTSAESRMKIVDGYGEALTKDRQFYPDESIEQGLEIVRSQREKLFKQCMEGRIKPREISKKTDELNKEQRRLANKLVRKSPKTVKEDRKKAKEATKEREKVARQKQEAAKEKQRIRAERELFWPRKTYTVKISLDVTYFTSPSSSRRSSISSNMVKISQAKNSDQGEEDGGESSRTTSDLPISYVTSDAGWKPSYDMAFSTTANTGQLYFDAMLRNTMSETWRNCKVILSTSQDDLSNLDEKVPSLTPWKVKLTSRGASASGNNNSDGLCHSPIETAPQSQPFFGAQVASKSRAELFGVERPGPSLSVLDHYKGQGGRMNACTFSSTVNGGIADGSNGLFGNVFRDQSAQQLAQRYSQKASASYGCSRARAANREGVRFYDEEEEEEEEEDDKYANMAYHQEEPAAPRLEYQDSTPEETGLTTTYDLPGTKTLTPSSTAKKQRVLRLTLDHVRFNHTVVPRHKCIAYLQAKFKNASSVTLLPGPAGLTLDGSFHGRTALPRCGPGDPAIRVVCPRGGDDVRRGRSGLLGREDHVRCARSVGLMNARSAAGARPAYVRVLDHVSVSEDERLRVETVLGEKVKIECPAAGKSGVYCLGERDSEWGMVDGSVSGKGEVTWEFELNSGYMATVLLAYDCYFPATERVVGVPQD